MDEDVHKNVDGYNDLAFWQQFGINYRTFGSDRQKLVDNAYAATLQRTNDVILLWRQSSLTRSWDARQSILTPNFDGFGGYLTP